MNDQSINKQYAGIANLLEKQRLKEAIEHLEAFSFNCNNWDIHNNLEQIRTSYQYMLQYMKLGMKDPERHKLHRQLLASAWKIADQTRLILLDDVSNHFYHSLRKEAFRLPSTYNLSSTKVVLESFTDELAVSQLADYQGLDEILKRHEDTLRTMFFTVWSNSEWSAEDAVTADEMLQSETMATNDLCMLASAATMSTMECFDERKVNWLLNASTHTNPQISQRALVGLVIALHHYPTRVSLHPELQSRISLFKDNQNFCQQLNRIYIQLLQSQETEKIDRKMREEIIPEMIKNANFMKNMKFGMEDTDENDHNPDWEKAFEDSGLGERIREMSNLQMEGADVYMSTFSMLKGYPFFNEPHNWFYPFDLMHSSIVHQMGVNENNDNSIVSIILKSAMFCNSDKYSFCFTMTQLPKQQRESILSQMNMQNSQNEELRNSELLNQKEHPELISNQYIHDLYRFFKLNPRRYEFHNIFQEVIALHRNEALKELLNDPKMLATVADFHFRKERYAEAIEIFRILTNHQQANADIFQKAGFCLQKEGFYGEAIEAYKKADIVKPDNIWTLRHTATCYKHIKDYDSALAFYQRVEYIQPENRNIIFNIGSCLVELKRYEEAMQYFFKLDFLENDSIKAWRGIGWCSFIIGKHQQAMKYYTRIIEKKPLAFDYLNMGHTAWVLGNIEKAAGLYAKSMEMSESKEAFIEMFNKDKESLTEQGIAKEDIPLMLDML